MRTEEAPQWLVDAILNAKIPEDLKRYDHELASHADADRQA